MSSAHSKDYISDVYMDISHQFFPLPSVAVPNITIKRPSIREKFQYSFESERKAIADYEKNKATLAVKMDEVKPTSVAAEEQKSDVIIERPSDVRTELHIQRINSNAILEPSRAVAVTIQRPQGTKPMKLPVNAFEEFESKPNLFDLLELRTIDDKAALEQILANASSQAPPPGVSGNNAQSSTRLLTASSVPNTGLSMSKTDDTHNLYNLPTAIESCNGSFGIGIRSPTFRRNL